MTPEKARTLWPEDTVLVNLDAYDYDYEDDPQEMVVISVRESLSDGILVTLASDYDSHPGDWYDVTPGDIVRKL